jgi:hypothetical protein
MRYPFLMALVVLLIAIDSPVVAAGQAASRAKRPKARGTEAAPPVEQAYKPPTPEKRPARTPDGQPNLQGIWTQSGTYTPLQRPARFADKPFFTEAEAEEFYKNATKDIYEGDPGLHYKFTQYGTDRWQTGLVQNMRTSIIIDPENGRLPPLTPEAQKRDNRGSMKGFPELALHTRCVTGYWQGGGPMIRPASEGDVDPNRDNGAQGETEILQTPGYVIIFTDSNNDTRIIPLDNRPRLAPTSTKWFGDSRGHWEGETLVVETTNFNDQVRVTGQMVRDMKLTERFTRRGENTLMYQFTVDAPSTWTRPWTGEVPWPRVEGPMYEAACTEENISLINMLKSIVFVREAEEQKKNGLK